MHLSARLRHIDYFEGSGEPSCYLSSEGGSICLLG